MALDGDILGTAIKDALKAGGYLITDEQAGVDPGKVEAGVEATWQTIANVIVTHITTNAVIPIGIAVQVNTGTGTGATTGTGTVT